MHQHTDIKEVLRTFWGYDSFRSLQEDVISSILEDRDTLALLPTGGGKSICFQVPALACDGLCLVISPLIALMKDQVAALKSRGIKADVLFSGQTFYEQTCVIDNVIYNETKFLYVSPERLKTDLFQINIEKLGISLIAVDEAHCISQWGYDFRPAYLDIADIRQYLPNVPILALTATATPKVVNDIQDKLKFKSHNVLRTSFERKNLSYLVYKEENKLGRLLRIANNVNGSGIVYMRNRKGTVEISKFLNDNNISADYYHAGLDDKIRDRKQNDWKSNKTRIIVATNAFGMGIDKPDVRFVVHLDIPDNIESYFQEVGRAGRDKLPAFGILLFNDNDLDNLQNRFEDSYPDIKTIQLIYGSLGNYYKLPVGSGENMTFDFNIFDFCRKYEFKPVIVHNALKIIENQGAITLSDAFQNPSRLIVKVGRDTLYDYQLRHPELDDFIQTLLRIYGGIFSEYGKIEETLIASRLGVDVKQVVDILKFLTKRDLVDYIPYSDSPKITFVHAVSNKKYVFSDESLYKQRKKIAHEYLDYITAYVTNTSKCRSSMLLQYFGEDNNNKRCGICDYCRKRRRDIKNSPASEEVINTICEKLRSRDATSDELCALFPDIEPHSMIDIIRWLIDYGIVRGNSDGTYHLVAS
ncbi:MAG: RecQ family ATP-dependent DNA helicase [Bacteroidales bacterium]|nr:RecQ family ATP-dependent DNA helicase [Bacteroidales bacterium]